MNTTRTPVTVFALLALLAACLLLACNKGEPDTTAAGEQTPTVDSTPTTTPTTEVKLINLIVQGQEFNPSIPVATIPNGGWMCVMGGLVHYASATEGNGICPICRMRLVQRVVEDSGSASPSTP